MCLERWLSGLKRWSRKSVDGNVSRVRIPLSPPLNINISELHVHIITSKQFAIIIVHIFINNSSGTRIKFIIDKLL